MKGWFYFLSRGGAYYDDEEEDSSNNGDEAEKEFIKRLVEHVILSITTDITKRKASFQPNQGRSFANKGPALVYCLNWSHSLSSAIFSAASGK